MSSSLGTLEIPFPVWELVGISSAQPLHQGVRIPGPLTPWVLMLARRGAVNNSLPPELKETLEFLVYWDLKVCILQIQFYHPVCLLDYVWQEVEAFHLKVLHLYEAVEAFEVYDWPLPSPFLFYHEELGDKTE